MPSNRDSDKRPPKIGAPSSDRVAVGGFVRDLRTNAGLTGQELVKGMGISQSKLSKIESGLLRPSLTDARPLASTLRLPAGVRDSLARQVRALHAELRSWRVLHRDGLNVKQQAIADLERVSSRLRLFQLSLVPGPLQTVQYARAVLRLSNVAGS